LSALLLRRGRYVATETDPVQLITLANRFYRVPRVEVASLDARSERDAVPFRGQFESVVCVNVLEHIDNQEAALHNMFDILRPGGHLVLLVPRGKKLFGSLDQLVGHVRRYEPDELRAILRDNGFEVQSLRHFNRVGVLGWWLNGRILKRKRFGKLQLKLYDMLVWVFKRLDLLLPWSGLSVIAVAKRPAESDKV
ncbi:unnamed protein product, partial [marine sediment metagenome]